MTRNPHATFVFASTQIGSTFQCDLDFTGFSSCDNPLELLELTTGEHTLRVRAVDPSGNIDQTAASYTWTVDGPPVTTITSFPAEDSTDSTATFAFTSSDAGSTFECFLDGVYEACTSPKSYSGLTRGDHVFAVRATDPSGNLELAWQEHEWSIGIGVDFTQAPADPTDSTTATFAFASTVPGAAMLCSLDGAPALPCTSPRTYTNLTAGQHEFSVEVIDPQRLVDPLPIIYSWTIVDVTAPETTIAEGPPNPSESAAPTFRFTSNEANTTFQCRLDSASSFTPCPVPATFEGLSFGPHTLRVRAVDSAGLFDLTPATWTWSIVADVTAPDTSIDSGPPTVNADIEGIFAFSGTDEGTPPLELQFECRLDAGDWEQCDSPHEVQDLAPGLHTLRVRAIDLELNIDQTPAVYTWDVLGPINTMPGSNVIVEAYQAEPPSGAEPVAAAEVTFPAVAVAGSTVMTELASAPPLPAGFMPAGAMYFDVRTTAIYLGQPMICFEFEPSSFATPQAVRLLHYTGGGWHDVSSSGDPANGEVCGTVSSFSPFALAMSTDPVGDRPPDTTLIVGPPALTVNFIHFLEFTGTDDWTLPIDLEFECLIDGVSLGTCDTFEEIEVDVSRRAPAAGAGDRRGRPGRPDTRREAVHDRRPDRARHRHRGRTGQPDHGPHGDVRVPRRGRAAGSARRHVRVRPRRGRLRPVPVAVHGHRPRAGGRRPRADGARRRPRRQRRPDAGHLRMADRGPAGHDGAGDDLRRRAAGGDAAVRRPRHVQLQRGRRRVRVLDRQRPVRRLRSDGRAHRPRSPARTRCGRAPSTRPATAT